MAQIAGLQDFRAEGPPGDIGVFQTPASVIVFRFTFSGTTRYVAMRTHLTGWDLITQNVDPAVAIEAAWTALSTLGGGMIYLSGPGERWTTATEINSQGNNVILRGGGKGSPEIYLGNGLDIDVFDVTHDDCKILFVHINGNGINQTHDDGASTNAVSRGIRNVGGDRLETAYCYIQDTAEGGVSYANCEGGSVHHNIFDGCFWYGVSPKIGPGAPAYGVDIHDNEVFGSGDVGISTYGSRTNTHHNYVHDIIGTHGSVNTKWGIGIEGGDHNKVHDNQIDGCLIGVSTGTVAGQDPQFWEIKGNTITNPLGTAGGFQISIRARNGKVVKNDICEIPAWAAPWPVGITVESGATDVEFEGNHFYSSVAYLGFKIDSESGLTFRGNHYHGTPHTCIRLQGACSQLFIGDERAFDGARGVQSDAASQCDDITIQGCYFYSLSIVAIDIQNCDDLFVTGNTIKDCALGLDISDANVVRAKVNANDFYGCTNSVNDTGVGSVAYGGNYDNTGTWVLGTEPDP